MTPTRRKMLAGGLLTLAGAMYGHTRLLRYAVDSLKDLPVDLQGPKTTVNSLVDAYPAQLPGAKSVEKHNYPDAKHCLVHIRQAHDLDLYISKFLTAEQRKDITAIQENVPKEMLEEIVTVQRSIYAILRHLNEHHQLKDVYNEGVTSEQGFREYIMDLAEDLRKNKAEDETMAFLLRTSAKSLANARLRGKHAQIPALEQQLKEYEDLARVQEYISLYRRSRESAVDRMYQEGRIAVIPAEDSAISEQVLERLVRGPGFFERHFPVEWYALRGTPDDAKENVVLQKVSQRNDTIAHTVYGSRHDWLNNVRRWNRSHPDDRFALIVITPEGYVENSKRRK